MTQLFNAKAFLRHSKEIVEITSIDFTHEEPYLMYKIGEKVDYSPLSNVSFINLANYGRNQQN